MATAATRVEPLAPSPTMVITSSSGEAAGQRHHQYPARLPFPRSSTARNFQQHQYHESGPPQLQLQQHDYVRYPRPNRSLSLNLDPRPHFFSAIPSPTAFIVAANTDNELSPTDVSPTTSFHPFPSPLAPPQSSQTLAQRTGASTSSPLNSSLPPSSSSSNSSTTPIPFPVAGSSSSTGSSPPRSRNSPPHPSALAQPSYQHIIGQSRTRRQSQQTLFGAEAQVEGSEGKHLEAKVVIFGSQGSGKTSLVTRYVNNTFSDSPPSTIGASFFPRKVRCDGTTVRLQLWDTAGQERFRSMAPLYYRGALAAVLVYDITDAQSFWDVKSWLEELQRSASNDIIIHIVGSKADASARRQVSIEEARKCIADWMYDLKSGSALPLSPTLGPFTGPVSPSQPVVTRTPEAPRMSTSRSRDRGTSLQHSTNRPPASTGPTSVAMSAQTSTGSSADGYVPKLPGGGMLPPATMDLSRSSSFRIPTGSTTPTANPTPASSSEMTRSGSRLSISLGFGLDIVGRKSGEEDRKSRKSHDDQERERREEILRKCQVIVSEVSAKDDYGIEEVFLAITRQLVQRKTQIESDQRLRSRESIFLSDEAAEQAVGIWARASGAMGGARASMSGTPGSASGGGRQGKCC